MSKPESAPPSRPPANQRKALRAPLIVQQVKLDDGRKAFFGYAKNISRSGLFIATVNPREPGERFWLEIPLPSPLGRIVCCTGEVVWKRLYAKGSPYEPGMGLKFLDLSEAEAELIDRWARQEADKQEVP